MYRKVNKSAQNEYVRASLSIPSPANRASSRRTDTRRITSDDKFERRKTTREEEPGREQRRDATIIERSVDVRLGDID